MIDKKIKWADFSDYGIVFKVSSAIQKGQRVNYLIFGKDKENAEKFSKDTFEVIAKALNCIPIERNGDLFYISAQESNLNLKNLVQTLRNNGVDNIKPKEMLEKEVYVDLTNSRSSSNEKRTSPQKQVNKTEQETVARDTHKSDKITFNLNEDQEQVMQKSFIIGKNRLGRQVREINGIDGLNGVRLVVEETPEGVVKNLKREPETPDNTTGNFLRSFDEATLSQCSDAFLNEIYNGEVKRYDDLENFLKVIYSDLDASNKEARMTALFTSIENSIGRLIKRKNTDLNSRDLFSLTQKIEENANYKTHFAKTRINKTVIDIPAPVSVAIHEIATTDFVSKDKTVTIVNPDSGTLFSKFSRGTNLEIFDTRASSLNGLKHSAKELGLKDENIISQEKANFENSDLIIMNVESDLLDSNFEFSGETFSRKEFKDIIEALESKKPEAAAFFSFKQPQDPDVIDEYKRFLEIIGRKYAIQGIANIDSSLHSGVINDSNLIVLSVAENRPYILDETPEMALREKEISSYPEVWTWCTETIRANKKITNEHLEYDEDDENKSDKERNYFQVPYVSASRLGQAETMVPKHLEDPTKVALNRMAKAFGDVDERVAVEVGFSKKHLSSVLAPEQIDAVALETYAEEKGKKGFLLGDMTGIGKGRTLAAMALRQINSGKKVVFLTQKDSNIRDLFRDFSDLGVSTKDFNYVIFNNNTSFDVEDPELGTITVSNETPDKLMEMIRLRQPAYDDDGNVIYENTYRWPEDENEEPVQIVFATYSQFSKALEKCQNEIDKTKIGFIQNVMDENTALLLDECQSAAGQSNTGRNIKQAVDGAGLIRYSSATHLKRASSTPIFNPLFPEHMSEEEVKDIMEKGGENIQEVVSSMLARDGVFLRREHDNSALEYETVRDIKNEQRNRDFVDQLSPILSELCYLSGDVNRRIQNDINAQIRRLDRLEAEREENILFENREEARQNRRQINNMKGVIKSMQGSKLSFGSPLYSLSKVALAALKTDTIVEMAIDDLKSGKKPVLIVDSTLETLLRELYLNQEAEGLGGSKEPDFKDLFKREVQKLTTRKCKDAEGNFIKDENGIIVRELVEPDNEELQQRLGIINDMIDRLPDLSVTFIDRAKSAIEDAGFNVGEITARKIEYRDGQLQRRKPEKKTDAVDKFNSGTYDAILINKSGSTGISLHAAEWFKDRRQRRMLKLDVSNDIIEEVQTDGRIHRRGQVVNPKIGTLDSGVPFETRLIATKNQKLRRLSANVTSNRENAALIQDVLDMINVVGDEVCARYANARPELLEQLGLQRNTFEKALEENDNEGNEDSQDNRRSANQILARLGMLPCAIQSQILDELQAEYEAKIMELEAENKNPLKPKQLKGEIVTREKTIFEGADVENPNNVFDDPVYIETCIAELTKDPIDGEMLDNLVAAAQERLVGEDGHYFADRLERIRMEKLNEAFNFVNRNNQYATLQGALDNEAPELIALNNRIDTLIDITRRLQPGSQIRITDDNGEPAQAIITKINYPERGYEHNISKYRFQYVLPGDAEPRSFSFDPLLKNQHFVNEDKTLNIWDGLNNDDMDAVDAVLNDFDNAQDFIQKRRVQILTGNTFRAMQIAVENKIGSMCVYYDKNEEIMKRGVIVSGNIRNLNLAVPVRMTTPEMCYDALNENNLLTLYPDQKRVTRAFTIKSLRGGESFELVLPHHRNKLYGKIYNNEWIANLRRDLEPVNGENRMGQKKFRTNNREQILQLMRICMNDFGINFYVDPKYRDWSNAWQERRIEYENQQLNDEVIPQ